MSDLAAADADAAPPSDLRAFAITLFWALAIKQTANQLKRRGLLSAAGTRKACHILVGQVYMWTWVNYSDAPGARYLAASVVALSCVQVLLVGLGVTRDKNLVDSMSRTGAASELLRGPLLYGAVSATWTVLGWRSSPSGIVGLQALYLGDGLAGLLGGLAGERWPRLAVPLGWNKHKTWIGSIACFLGTALGALAALSFFSALGHLPSLGQGPGQDAAAWGRVIRAVCAAAISASAIESLPVKELDNLTVPLAASLTMAVLMG